MAHRISFYTDEQISKAVVLGLRQRGVDVLTCVEAGLRTADDCEHLERARIEGRVVVTQDRDFLRLHATGIGHAGIAYAIQGTSIGDFVRGLMLIHQVLERDDMIQHVEYI